MVALLVIAGCHPTERTQATLLLCARGRRKRSRVSTTRQADGPEPSFLRFAGPRSRWIKPQPCHPWGDGGALHSRDSCGATGGTLLRGRVFFWGPGRL